MASFLCSLGTLILALALALLLFSPCDNDPGQFTDPASSFIRGPVAFRLCQPES